MLTFPISQDFILIFCLHCRPLKGFPGSSASKESPCNAGDSSSTPGLGRSPGEGLGYPLPCSWTSLVAQMVKNLPTMWEIRLWIGEIYKQVYYVDKHPFTEVVGWVYTNAWVV